jgi:muramoyltetrapeptide carboxypeptidase
LTEDSSSRRKFLKRAGIITAGVPALMSLSIPVIPEDEDIGLVVKPPALNPGDKVAIISPAGAVFDPVSVQKFEKIITDLGYVVVKGKTCSLRTGYFAGTDEERADDFMCMVKDPTVKAILCAKGGWGCARILPLLNFDIIRTNPKIICGFSDITTLLNAIWHKSKLVTFHGPVGNSGWNDFSVTAFHQAVKKDRTIFHYFDKDNDTTVYSPGKAEGIWLGGNLTVFCSLLGTPYMPEVKHSILFLEDTMEEPYSIDRMLTQLKLAGVFDKIKGIAFGKCTKCIAEEPDKAFTIQEVFAQHFSKMKIPVVTGLPIGHTEQKLTIPLGCNGILDTSLKLIQFTEKSVS